LKASLTTATHFPTLISVISEFMLSLSVAMLGRNGAKTRFNIR